MINYYVILEIPNFSDQTVIKKAYRKLSKKYHPDVNKDPFANTYFLKINEAYDFLSDENKRLLLHQFLYASTINQKAKINNETQTSENYQVSKPIIHFFKVNKNTYEINDKILIEWHVSQCKSVHITFLGLVLFNDARYLKVDHFSEEIIIVMTVIGLDDLEYKYRINLVYQNNNPAKTAFEKMKIDFSDVDPIHFKKETFFGLHARIEINTFKNRMVLLGILFFINFLLLSFTTAKVFFFIVLIILSWLIFSQTYKRMHDTFKYKNKVWMIFIPLYNIIVLKELFVLQSEPQINPFGVIPKKIDSNFGKWFINGLKNLNAKLTLIQKTSFGCFIMLVACVTFKTLISYKEIPAKLTSYYIENSRPTTSGEVYSDYFLVFNNNISVNVSREYYYSIAYKNDFDTYKLAFTNDNKIEYIKLFNSKTNETNRLSFGILKSNNPLLLVILLLFLGQLYVWRNLTAPNELPFANAYMVFVMFFYLYGLFVILFN